MDGLIYERDLRVGCFEVKRTVLAVVVPRRVPQRSKVNVRCFMNGYC